MALRAAVVLCGSGRGDGSEIHESVSVLMHLARLGVAYQCFAPDQPQHHVINHLTGQVMPEETRNCLVEAARIARGEVRPLAHAQVADFDMLVIPGGFGAAKNLCTFAFDGAGMNVQADAARLVTAFHSAGKPIGLCCIAPVIAARLIAGVRVTLGPEGPGHDAPRAIAGWGAVHQAAAVDQCVIDRTHKVITAPAYMYGEANPWQISLGIGKMVEATVRLSAQQRGVTIADDAGALVTSAFMYGTAVLA
jgi:enhancing lycopene biosynthesis protein 2